MSIAVRQRAKQAAEDTLYRLLDYHKSNLRSPEQRIEAEQFFPVNTRALVQLLGWTLEQVSMVGYASSGEPLAAKCIRGEKKIILLSTLADEQKQFSLAHELGHVLLHAEIPDCNAGSLPRVLSMLAASKKKRTEDFSEIEREAEVFARELLMPERAVRRQFRTLFGVDRLRAASGSTARFAPRSHRQHSVDVRDVAQELAKWANPGARSLAQFFGVGSKAISSRLIGLSLVY
jgi:Zn-dependent peptidase ImmA (M78 family)